jgi:hypothetical protein
VVFSSTVTREERNEQGETQERVVAFLRCYTVFNVAQIDGLPAPYGGGFSEDADAPVTIAAAERLFVATGATVRHGSARAFYDRARWCRSRTVAARPRTREIEMSTPGPAAATIAEREAAVDDAIASVELEGLSYDGGVHEILYRHARGEISDAQRDAAVERLLEQIQSDAAQRPVPVPSKRL